MYIDIYIFTYRNSLFKKYCFFYMYFFIKKALPHQLPSLPVKIVLKHTNVRKKICRTSYVVGTEFRGECVCVCEVSYMTADYLHDHTKDGGPNGGAHEVSSLKSLQRNVTSIYARKCKVEKNDDRSERLGRRAKVGFEPSTSRCKF